LVSAGRRNGYGHPSNVVLERLARRGVIVLRTDQHGRIRLRWRDRGPLRVEVARAPLLGGGRPARVRLGAARLVFDSLAPP
jgi:beta-lactamase superfamily II metal-dependent hydrolase